MTLLRRITIAAFLLLAAAFNVAAQSPRGEMLKLQISDSESYPGTVRNVSVYVPQQYDGTRPACLFVRMDGLGHNIPQIFDELIDEGAMPVTIGVFITSGRIYDEKGEVVRYNRSNEFDRMTSTWVEFIENEVLPAVERLTTSDGRRIMLSKNPADRAINGDSSGGIASFTAAWSRPDLYSRVYCIVGTFVPMRGGDGYPALIRKYEPKPLRIFLQDNDNDSWNLTFGSWYEYNLLMASALRYAGYDVRTQWDEGGHSGTNGGRIMKDVLRWLWAGWPAPIEPRFGDNALINSLVIPGEGWRQVSRIEGFHPTKHSIRAAPILQDRSLIPPLSAPISSITGRRSMGRSSTGSTAKVAATTATDGLHSTLRAGSTPLLISASRYATRTAVCVASSLSLPGNFRSSPSRSISSM